ncbi:MAG: tRNA epoxyqueuosine(34) reductase QueG [Bacteroidales bacterium]|nr:tRNA epoxyqueuosine(34) reductase QueG [Bacteroidales bacterium]
MNRDLTQKIKQHASRIGFFACGISRAEPMVVESGRLKKWVAEGLHGDMHYLASNPDKRANPRQVLEHARSVISLLYNYYPRQTLPKENNLYIARFVYGKDYHILIKEKLNDLIAAMKHWIPGTIAIGFADAAPVMEKALAQRAGLGWIGKNMLLIHPERGSYFFIGEIITTLELEYDQPHTDQCGSCRRCLEACPTGALTGPYRLDARKCITYLTDIYKGELPDGLRTSFESRIYGCDACQEACPFNRLAVPHNDPDLLPTQKLKEMNRDRWENLTEGEFQELFEHSAVKRISYPMFRRNIDFVGGK